MPKREILMVPGGDSRKIPGYAACLALDQDWRSWTPGRFLTKTGGIGQKMSQPYTKRRGSTDCFPTLLYRSRVEVEVVWKPNVHDSNPVTGNINLLSFEDSGGKYTNIPSFSDSVSNVTIHHLPFKLLIRFGLLRGVSANRAQNTYSGVGTSNSGAPREWN